MAVEQDLVERGWVPALSPADADILCLCGEPAADLAGVLDRIWDELPSPRARTTVVAAADIDGALTACARELADPERQASQAGARNNDAGSPDSGDHGQMDDGDMDHGSMDHGGMDMPMPDGIALAGQGSDRDGLDLDELQVPLGPVLPAWPAGLVLRCTLQGDVVMSAQAEWLSTGPGAEATVADSRAVVVHQTDLASRLLRLAGSTDAAGRMERIRNQALASGSAAASHGPLTAELSRLKRSFLLRRSLRGVGRVGTDAPRPEAGTDVWDRLLGMVEAAVSAAAGVYQPPSRLSRQVDAALLADLAAGLELGTVRLIVASFDLSPVAALTAAAR
ncbi:hypothetical protein [Arthrobacter sp. FB24]|uniref:hypothetical protein n=1 Tax=Arthrobacter sp. (strain FB24) TaxID=290399 RepID=UPI0002FAFEC2|nr:hypothetical protein [Arthrobacter sp. FB24]